MSGPAGRRRAMPAAMLCGALALCCLAAAGCLHSQTTDRRVPSGDAAVPAALAQAARGVGFLDAGPPAPGSVPDGGTVLMGGIKRMREGRNEYGVPILSKIPYVNRLFKNVGIARTTQSLMLMVTPRIIIQEEEEDKLLGQETP